MGSYRWLVGDLRTGRVWRTVDLTGTRGSAAADGDGTLEGSAPLGDGTDWPTAYPESTPVRAFLACEYLTDGGTSTIVQAGPVWTRRFNDATRSLQIGAASLASYFDHRKVIPVLPVTANPSEASVTYTGAELGLIAKRLVELAQSHTGGTLPIVLPPDADLGGPGDAHTRTYPGYELGWVGDRLQQLSEVDGGPEIQFEPRRRPDDPRFIEWVMRVGRDVDGGALFQSGAPWVFDRTVRQSEPDPLSRTPELRR